MKTEVTLPVPCTLKDLEEFVEKAKDVTDSDLDSTISAVFTRVLGYRSPETKVKLRIVRETS